MGNGITAPIVPSTVFLPQSSVPNGYVQSIQNLLAGNKWGTSIGSGIDLTYSFTNYSSIFNYSTEGMLELKLMTENQKNASLNAMSAWAKVCNVTFSAVTESSSSAGDIRWSATTSSAVLTTTEIVAPNTASNGDIWIGPNNGGYNSSVAGTYSMDTYMHELGHALGLDHPHESAIAPVSGEDQLKYSIMSYRSFAGDSATGNYGNTYFPTTPMLNDIAAVQYLYGANTSYETGDDTYVWSDGQKIFETIWDAGGMDTIDASNQSIGVSINLTSGQWSQIGGSFWNGQSYVRDCLTIAYGAVIENAKGSAFTDTLEGNSSNNMLEGLGGNDFLNGGAGDDIAIYSSNASNYIMSKNLDGSITIRDNLSSRDGTDTLLNIEQIKFADSTIQSIDIVNVVDIIVVDTTTITGTSSADTLTGDAGANILNGGLGADKMIGGLGNDTYYVDNVNDTVIETSALITEIDTVNSSINYTLGTNLENLTLISTANLNGTGNTLNNVLIGNSGANILDGKAGSDTMQGGTGNDIYVVDNLGDSVIETSTINTETDTVISYVNFTLGTNIEDLVLTGTKNINGTGNNANNTIYAGTGSNILNGAEGTDTLSYVYGAVKGVTVSLANTATAQVTGGSGSDKVVGFENLIGSKYNDKLTGSSDNNVLNGGLGNDILTGGAGQDTFVFNTSLSSSNNKDTITDFSAIDDTIQLENAIFKKLTATGTLLADNFVANNTGKAVDSNDYIVYNKTTGALLYDADGSGSGSAIQIGILGTSTHPTITYSDFLVS